MQSDAGQVKWPKYRMYFKRDLAETVKRGADFYFRTARRRNVGLWAAELRHRQSHSA